MQNQACLWTPAELSGWLDKKGTGYNKWNKRFFILKGSGLFYFSDIKASTAKGVIPIELAKVEAARDTTEKKRFLIKVWVAAAYTDISKHKKYILSSPSLQVQATWVTLLWYASVPRPDMLAQLHASGLLQSLLLKYMQAAYARMQTALIQDSTGNRSLVGVQADGQEPAQGAAVQDAMQLMFGQEGRPTSFVSDAEAAQDEDASPSYKPALMQRLSVLARSPGDTPSMRPFNMLGTHDIAQAPSAQFSGPPSGEAGMYSSAGFQPQMLQSGGMQANMDQARLSMTGMVMGAGSADESWMHQSTAAVPSGIESPSTKLSSRKSGKHRNKRATADEHRHDPSEAGSALAGWDGIESSLQPEFSFSPLGDNSSCIQQEIAFSPLAVGAGQFTARPSIRQRIRKSLFGPAKDTAPGSEAKAGKAEVQHLPRMSAAYGFMANPAGLSPQLSQPVPAGEAWHPRHTLLPASPMTAHQTPKLLVQNTAAGGSRRSAAGEPLWSGKPQQAGPAPAVGSPNGQPASGEASRGRSPVPDPTGAEDSPLAQVIQQQRAALKPVAVSASGGVAGSSSSVAEDSDDAELQSLIQQQRIALRHLEALTGRRAAQRTSSASGDGASALPRRALAGTATTPEPDSPMSPLPQKTLFSRATTPIPDSADRQVHNLTRLRQLPSMSCSPEATPFSPPGPPAQGGLQSQLAAVTLRHRSSPTATTQTPSAKNAIATGACKGRSPPPPPPPPPPLSCAASPERLSRLNLSPGPVLQSPAIAARLISECYSDVSPAMSSVQNAHSQSNFLSQSSISPRVLSPPPPPPPPPGAHLPNRSVDPQQQARVMTQALNPAAMHSRGQSQQPLAEARQTLTGDVSGCTSIGSQGSPARPASSWKPSSLAAGQQQLQAQQPSPQSLVHLRPVQQATIVQPGSSQQQEWQGQAENTDASLSIRAVYSEVRQAGSLQSQPRLDQLQAAFKQGWPTVQTNPLYQKVDAAAVPGGAGSNPEKKRGWVVCSQPSIDTNRTDGHSVQMLRQTWVKPATNIPKTQSQQQAEDEIHDGLQTQLQAIIVERRNKFSHQLQ
ncbi:hypothetical protein WJX77_010237 [Trebouxia sp. C0004]